MVLLPKTKRFRRNDWVIFRTTKHSTHPGRRAQSVFPAEKGEGYTYCVDKFWIVDDIQQKAESTQIVLRTRRGKERIVEIDDPRLRQANWYEKLMFGHRFPLPKDQLEEISEVT